MFPEYGWSGCWGQEHYKTSGDWRNQIKRHKVLQVSHKKEEELSGGSNEKSYDVGEPLTAHFLYSLGLEMLFSNKLPRHLMLGRSSAWRRSSRSWWFHSKKSTKQKSCGAKSTIRMSLSTLWIRHTPPAHCTALPKPVSLSPHEYPATLGLNCIQTE